jgi:O-acetylserine/cysteine efflux transporter
MAWRDYATAVAVAFVWGLSFVVSKFGVSDMPPLMLNALRFLAVVFPAILFVRRPRAPFWIVTAYGLSIGVFQLGLMFVALALGMPAGLTSLIVQAQAFFSIPLFWLFFRERPTAVPVIGALAAMTGIVLIGSERTEGASLVPFLMVIGGAAAWSFGNVFSRMAGRVDMLSFLVWSSLAAPLPLLALSWMIEGDRGFRAVARIDWPMVGVIAYSAYLGSIFGYGLWARLLSRHSAAEVTPFALLVPIFGMAAGRIFYGEPLTAIEGVGAALVLAGLSWNVFGARILAGIDRWRAA